MDAPSLLRRDHRQIDRLLRSLQAAGPKETRRRKQLRKQLVEDLAVHQDIEEQVVYPTAEKEAAKTKPAVMKAHEQHELIKGLLNQLKDMSPQEEAFDPKVAVLADLTRTHFAEEDRAIIRPLATALTADQLGELGRRIQAGREAITNPKEYLAMD
jgi:hemerythrin superfamily protein